MARGESQTLLIWTIIFLILLLIMIIVTVVMRSKLTEATSLLADATSKNQQLTTENGTLKTEGGKLREMIGYADAATPVADIETDLTKNLEQFAPTTLPESTSYITALKDLFGSYKGQITKNESLNNRNLQLQANLDGMNAAKVQLQADFDAKAAVLSAENKNLQDNHEKQLAVLKATALKREDDAKVAINAAIDLRDEAFKLRDVANLRAENVASINEGLTRMIADIDSPTPTYHVAEILWVSSDSSRVTVNLGSRDGLRPRMSFSVYSADVKEISVNASKGTVEIMKVIDANTAEARVTGDILMNPMIPGDIIYTPLWKPGQNIHVALLDGIDLDGDGISDPHKVISLINMGGGVVDTYIDDLTGDLIDEKGKMVREAFLVGQIGNQTRYLVIGNTPDPDSSETLFNARRDLQQSAKDYGLITMTLQDLLALMGQRQQSQTVGFGPRNRAINNYEMQPDVLNQRMPGRVFDKYENPDNYDKPGISVPFTNNKTPMSPLFNQRQITLPSGTVSPLFQPRTAPTKEVESR